MENTDQDIIKELRIQLEQEVAKRKKVEELLKETVARYQTFFDQAADGIMVMPINGDRVLVNKAFAEMHGYSSPHELAKMSLSDLDAPGSAELAPERLSRLLAGEGMNFDVEHYCKDGRKIPLNVSCNIVKLGDKQYFLGFHRDISEKKRAEAALQESEEIYRLHFSQVDDVIYSVDTEFKVFNISPSVEKIIGYQPDQLIGRPFQELNILAPEYLEQAFSDTMRVLSGEIIHSSIYEFIANDGTRKFGEVSGAPLIKNNKVTAVVCVARDITERVKAQAALKESEEKYRLIFDSAPVGIFHYDLNGVITACNPKALAMIGASKEQIVGMKIFESPIDESWRNCLSTALTGMACRYEGEYTTYTTSKKLYANAVAIPISSDQGSVIGGIAVIEDVTGRVKAEKSLVESQKNLQTMFDAITESAFLLDTDGVLLALNRTMAQRLGSTVEEMLGKPFTNFLSGDIGISRKKRLEEIVRAGEKISFEDIRSGRHVQNNCYPIKDDKGNVVRVAVFARDIHDYKVAEDTLRESEQNLKSIFDAIPEALILVDIQGTVVAVNKTMAERLYSTPDELLGKNVFNYLPSEAVESRLVQAEKAIRGRKPVEFEGMLNNRHRRINFYPIVDDNDRVIRFVIFGLDIHDQKIAEEALRESEEKARALLDATTDAVVLFNPEGIVQDVNESWARKFNVTKNEIIGQSVWQMFPSEVSEYRKSKIQKVVDSKKIFHDIEKEGKQWISINVYPIVNEAGNVSKLAVFVRDITEQKKAEDELKESHEQLKILTKHLQSVREQERTRIARGLHDELGQVLTAINLEVSAISNSLPQAHQHLKSRAEAAAELAVGAIQSIRRIISELRPSLIDDLGLAEAIRWQAREYQNRMGIRFDIVMDPEDLFVDDDLSIAVFRIFQEATTNAIRHSHATRISISLKQTDAGVELKIKDNGIGISKDRLSGNGSFGIKGMQERAEAFNGTVNISGISGKGTTLVARFPI